MTVTAVCWVAWSFKSAPPGIGVGLLDIGEPGLLSTVDEVLMKSRVVASVESIAESVSTRAQARGPSRITSNSSRSQDQVTVDPGG